MKQILVFIFIAAVLTSCTNINKVLKSNDYNYKLKMADKYYADKKYNLAQVVYEDVFPVFKGSPEFEEIYYKWAYCHYYQKDYMNSENIFKGFVETFPNSARAEECEFLRAYSFFKQSPRVELDQTTTFKAITFLQTFVNKYPNSTRVREAVDIIDKLEDKLEEKGFKTAELYYNLGYYRASAVAATELLKEYFDSDKADAYKLMSIKSYAKFAEYSVLYKQEERYEDVLNECADFYDRFPDSPLASDVDKFKKQADSQLKTIRNEQVKATTK